MKLVLKIENIVCFAAFQFIINLQIVSCRWPPNSSGTYYIKYDDYDHPLQGEHHHDEHGHHSHPEHQEHKHPKPDKHTGIENTTYLDDYYTFVALIEIMFTDRSSRNCTGAIIHDNVVVTAAHCFEMKHLRSIQPELTGSFVIIGSKQMFDSGYEQYLPIERVLLHPDYKEWSADLALVYTFSGMMSDKPGNVIPLADGNSFTSVHSNVTVINWNHMIKKKVVTTTTKKSYHSDSCSDSSEDAEGRYYRHRVTHAHMTQRIYVSTEEDISSPTTKAENYQQSTLLKEEYSIFEAEVCRQMILKLRLQFVDETKIVCYTVLQPNKIQGNYGALSIHRNHLVAVAAGEISNDIEHIIIGTKISCYCSWIGENLPGGATDLNCCTNCCERKLSDLNTEKYF